MFKRFSEAKSGILFCTVRVCLFNFVFAEFPFVVVFELEAVFLSSG